MKLDVDYIAKIKEVARSYGGESAGRLEREILRQWLNYEACARLSDDDLLALAVTPDRETLRACGVSLIKLLYDVPGADARADVEQIFEKNAAYGEAWCKRGGVGAFHALARKGDRFVTQLAKHRTIAAANAAGSSESLDDTLGDLRRYLILVESVHVARETAAVQPVASVEDLGAVIQRQMLDGEKTRHMREIAQKKICTCGHSLVMHVNGSCCTKIGETEFRNDSCECVEFRETNPLDALCDICEHRLGDHDPVRERCMIDMPGGCISACQKFVPARSQDDYNGVARTCADTGPDTGVLNCAAHPIPSGTGDPCTCGVTGPSKCLVHQPF